ncbi:MAG: hypothetical protein EOL95_09755 [Bacteroidia bacterium]|nr:hypothetical protein [Bacteroidia bacterium]
MAIIGTYDFNLVQGDDLTKTFTITVNSVAKDLTDYTINMQIRKDYNSSPYLSLSTGSGITLSDPTNGEFTVTITDAQSKLFNFVTAIYDIQLTDTSGLKKTYVKGTITLIKEVTKI